MPIHNGHTAASAGLAANQLQGNTPLWPRIVPSPRIVLLGESGWGGSDECATGSFFLEGLLFSGNRSTGLFTMVGLGQGCKTSRINSVLTTYINL